MKVVVTGGSGQLGTAVLERLVAARKIKKIVSLDLVPPVVPSPRIDWRIADMRDPGLERHLEGADALIHLAFLVAKPASVATMHAINVEGSQRIFEAAAQHGVRKIVYSSSVAAYGVVPGLPVPIVETTPRQRSGVLTYADNKWEVEDYLDGFEVAHPDVAVVRLRPGILLGRRVNGREGDRRRRCCRGGGERLWGHYHRDCRRGGSCGTRCRSWLAAGCASGREGGDMIAVPAGVRVLVATKPVDFRKGGDGLVALVRETLGEDPFSGTIFIFRAKRADRVKILAWDGSGLVLFWKRLEHGAFKCSPTIRIGPVSNVKFPLCGNFSLQPPLPSSASHKRIFALFQPSGKTTAVCGPRRAVSMPGSCAARSARRGERAAFFQAERPGS